MASSAELCAARVVVYACTEHQKVMPIVNRFGPRSLHVVCLPLTRRLFPRLGFSSTSPASCSARFSGSILLLDGLPLPARAPPAQHVEQEARCRVAAQQLRAGEDGRHDGRPTRRRRRGFGYGRFFENRFFSSSNCWSSCVFLPFFLPQSR